MAENLAAYGFAGIDQSGIKPKNLATIFDYLVGSSELLSVLSIEKYNKKSRVQEMSTASPVPLKIESVLPSDLKLTMSSLVGSWRNNQG